MTHKTKEEQQEIVNEWIVKLVDEMPDLHPDDRQAIAIELTRQYIRGYNQALHDVKNLRLGSFI